MKTKSPLTLTIAAVSLFIIGAHPTIAGTFASTQSGSWGSAATWGGAGVPGCGDTVTISGGTTVTESGTNCSGDLTVNGTLDMANNFFDFEGTTFTNNGALTSSVGFGEFDFNGVGGASGTTQNLAGAGTYNSNGRVDFHSRQNGFVVPASGTVLNGLTNWNIDGGSTISVSNDFVVNGLTGAGQFTTFNNGGAISGTGILKTHNNVAINGCGGMSAPVEVVAGTTSANCNLGAITVDSGATLFETGTLQSSDLTILSGGTLDMNDQFYSFIGTTFTNNGAVISSSGGNGEFDFNGVGGASGTTQNLAGAGTYNSNGRVDFHSRQNGFVVPASGTVLNGLTNWNIDGGSTISVSNDFVVNGLTGAGQFTTFNNGGAISGTGILKTHNNVAINGCGGMSAPVEVVAGTTSANCNLGAITVDSGATLFETGTLQSSDLTILSGGTLDMNDQFYSFIGTTFTNNGAVISSSGGNGEFDFNGVGGASGTTQNLAGAGTYNSNGRVDFHSRQNGFVVPASGTVLNGLTNWNIDGGSTISVSNDFVVNGLTGAGQFTTFNNGGAISGTGILKTHNNVAINGCGGMSAPVEVVAGTTSANCNLGAITVDSGATLFETGTLQSSDLTILSGGTLDMNDQFYSFIGTTFTNNGAVITSSGGNGEFDFNGVGGAAGMTQNVDGMGTYNTNGQINFHDRQSTNVVIVNGAVVAGVFNHNIDGGSTLTNTGTMSPGFPPGQANVNGNWQLGSTSNLSFEIEGTTQGTDYDVFATNSALTLNGNLVVRLLNGFTPGSSDTFTILTTPATLQGAFGNVASGGRLATADGHGSFVVTYSGQNNVVLSQFASSIAASKVIAVSARAPIKDSKQVLTCRFTINGTDPTKVIIRGLGPSLGMPARTVSDPTLTLQNQNGATLATNDNWKSAQQSEIEATGLAPSSDQESAIVITLVPGTYTAILGGATKRDGGLGKVDVHDLSPSANSALAIASSLGFVGVGDEALFGDFTIGAGSGKTKVLIRALGPSLEGLQDPTLKLENNTDFSTIYTNDNWQSAQAAQIQATGLAPHDPRESAILIDLDPGNYLAVVQGNVDKKNRGTTGFAKVEVYQLSASGGGPTPTPTPTPTTTPTPTPTPTATPTPTPTPTATPTPTPTPTATPTPTPTGGAAQMISPPPGSTFSSSTVTFSWTAGSATTYALAIGSTPQKAEIYNSGAVHVTSVTVNNIPTDGRTIYVALASQVNGTWTTNRYTYTASHP